MAANFAQDIGFAGQSYFVLRWIFILYVKNGILDHIVLVKQQHVLLIHLHKELVTEIIDFT